MTEVHEQQCGSCGRTQVPLFFIPGGWGWFGDVPGRYGLCAECGYSGQYRERFLAHFGEVRHVSDSDSARTTEAVTGPSDHLA